MTLLKELRSRVKRGVLQISRSDGAKKRINRELIRSLSQLFLTLTQPLPGGEEKIARGTRHGCAFCNFHFSI